MSDGRHAGEGPGNGRNWSVVGADEAPIEWTVDSAQGGVQGPLDLGFLVDKRIVLILTEGQQALLVQNGRLRTVYLDGMHHLDVGEGPDRIDPTGRLVFLATPAPFQLSWPRTNPLRWGPGAHQVLIGSCALQVLRPGAFFDTFLLGVETPDPAFVTRLVDQAVRGLFELVLAGEDAVDANALQARLTRLTPADLNEDLEEFGLSCTHLAVYTATPPSEENAPSRPASAVPVPER
jgi:hypothetical protein